jgi:alanine racemase
MTLRSFVRSLMHPKNADPLIEVGISKANLLHNLHAYQSAYPGVAIAPVLKSNAYGHGLATVARILDQENLPFLMLDSLYEAQALRREGIATRILILGYVRPKEIAASSLRDVDFAIVDVEQLRELAALARTPLRLHLEIDTGMHRHGLMPDQLQEAIALLASNARLHAVGAYSHFADADTPGSMHGQRQIAAWKDAKSLLEAACPRITHWHLSATAGMPFAQEAGTNLGRLGIGLYGFDASVGSALPLQPALELRSVITSLRTVPAADSVGYNATYTAASPRIIATVPLGYFEGIDRRSSNAGMMLVHGKAVPIAGRVSMNMTSLDVTDIPGVARADTVIAISRTPEDPNSVQAIAALWGTIPYEVLVHIPQHLRRVVE